MKKNIFITIVAIGFILTTSSCEEKYNPQKIYKNDSDYFIGLQKLKNGNNQEARRFFEHAAKKGGIYASRKSLEQLVEIGNIQEKILAAEKLYDKYKDKDSLLKLLQAYDNGKEHTKIILNTNKIDYFDIYDSIAYIRLMSLKTQEDFRLDEEVFTWFTQKNISAYHSKFYSENKDYFSINPENNDDKKLLMTMLINIYHKNYRAGYEKFCRQKENLIITPLIISAAGKASLYGSENFLQDALYFKKLAENLSDKEQKFYAYFYAGRLYEKAVNYFSNAEACYRYAMENSINGKQYDNVLWYLLQLNLSVSTDKGIAALKQYCSTWHNPSYFDDFMETLATLLLSQSKWDSFYEIYRTVDGYASDEKTAKFAYIYGRLLQEGYATSIVESFTSQSDAAFTRALTSGTDSYYRVMAITALNLAGERAEEILTYTHYTEERTENDAEAEKFLMGYAAFGLPEKIYPEWLFFVNEQKSHIGFETAAKLSKFLNECGNEKNEYYTQSLRIAAKALPSSDIPITKEMLKLLYPRCFEKNVSEKCAKYSIPEEIMYSLIRSESFFDVSAYSHAGAKGLTQLMDSTAKEISKKLKLQEYSILDADNNIEMGAFYLKELANRLEGNWLNAFFSYNGGITRLRRMLKSSRIQFKTDADIPSDIFLESLPIEETRGYGRKLIAAAVYYGWLYYDKNPVTTVSEIIK